MLSLKNSARLIGVLYIIGTVAGVMSVVFTDSILRDDDYLSKIAENDTQLVIGAVCVLIMGLALALVPVVIFPILKRFNETLATGYLIFRGALETFTYILIVMSWLILLSVSRDYVKADNADLPHLESLGNMLMASDEWMSELLAIVFILGGMMLYYILYTTKLIPRWLSVWGLIGTLPYLVSALLAMFDVYDVYSSTETLLRMPIAFQEMVMALWLIVRGFNTTALATPPSA